MAKKKEKGKKQKESSNPADALREAVERTFAGAAGGAAGAQKRAQELFDDVTQALTRLRDAVEERRVLETLDTLKDQVEGLASRVAALERREGASATASTTPATTAPTAPKTGGTRARTSRAGSG